MDKKQSSRKQKCAICKRNNQESGKIDCCQHSFCFSCLTKWAKKETTCPVCEETFFEINKIKKTPKSKPIIYISQDDFSKNENKSENNNQAEDVQQNIFSILQGPQTRNNHVKFLQLYSVFDELLQE